MWRIPPKANSSFVCAMEDVLTVYKREYNPDMPKVCMDETSKQLIKETRLEISAKPGKLARYDYEYERNGACLCSTTHLVASDLYLLQTDAQKLTGQHR